MKSVEEMEQPAKQWQVDGLQKDISTANKKLDTVITKLDGSPTVADLDAAKKEGREYTDGKIGTIETKYSPIYKLFWTLITAVAVEAVLIALQLTKG